MKRTINLISDRLNMAASVVASVAVLVILICCFIQVVCRYILNASLSWSEELARYVFVWASMLGFSVATKHGTNATIDVISSRLKGTVRFVHTLLCDVVIILICVIMTYFGCVILPTMAKTFSAALLIPNQYLYAAVPVSGALIIVHSLCHIVNTVDEFKNGRPADKEEVSQ